MASAAIVAAVRRIEPSAWAESASNLWLRLQWRYFCGSITLAAEVSFRPMTRRFVLVAASLVLLSVATAGAQKAQYRARLSPVPLDIAMQATIAGSGSVTATLNGTTLTLTGNYAGLKTASTVARVHRSPRTAMRGTPIGELKVTPGMSGTITGTLELTSDQVDDLANGRLYVQLHSEKAPDGNLWGWLLPLEGKK